MDRLGTRNTADHTVRQTFESAHFTGTVKEIKFNVAGDLEVRIIIPHEERSEGIKLADGYGLDIEFVGNRKRYGNAG